MNVYFDNAATTSLDDQVFEAMLPYLRYHYGNPSSTHAHGREARSAIETARKTVAAALQADPAEIFFTSGGSEGDNTAILSAVQGMGIRHVITSRLEHHAVLNTIKALERNGETRVSYISNDEYGNLDLHHLEQLLRAEKRSFVSVMHGNNEVGNVNDLVAIGQLCKKYNAVFHSDTVQTVGHFQLDVSAVNVDFLVGSAHKFHGPKGVGFLFARNSAKLRPLIHGGSQERRARAGTENVAGIVGLATAIEIACRHLDRDRLHIEALKRCCIDSLTDQIPGIRFNGNAANLDKSLYTVLSISLPPADTDLLTKLDRNGISLSGGSACNSNSHTGSHVLTALSSDVRRQTIRVSFSKFNTLEHVDFLVEKLLQASRALAVA